MNAFLTFLAYQATGLVLLTAFVFLYTAITPYKEFKLIKEGNSAAAVTLAGAMIGFCLPLASSIYYTQSIVEMTLWACITLGNQLLVFLAGRLYAGDQIEKGNMAWAITLCSTSCTVGLINAVSISY